MYKVDIAPSGLRDLGRIRGRDIIRVKQGIMSLETSLRPSGVKKLKGVLHRIRVGDWRILYAIEDRIRTVTILRVLRRSERTYKGI